MAVDANADTAVFDEMFNVHQNNGLDLPDIGFSQFDAFSDINRVMASKYGIYPYQNEDAIEAFRLDFKYLVDSDFISSIEFGARYSDREYSSDRSVFEYGSDSGFPRNQPPLQLTSDIEVVDGKASCYSQVIFRLIWIKRSMLGSRQVFHNQYKPGYAHPNIPNAGQGPNTSWSVTESGDVFEEVIMILWPILMPKSVIYR